MIWNPFPRRRVQAGFAEVRVPLVAPKHRWPLVRQLDLNLAARSEEYSDIRSGAVLTPRYGIAWRPLDLLLLRGSYGEGFLVPNLYNTLPIQTTSNTTMQSSAIWIDPSRGNTIAAGQPYISYGGGNPNLKPQTSQNWTYGAVLDVPKIKGLSLSIDYFDNQYENRFGNISLLSDRVLYAPETIIRGPNLPGDLAGWDGPIVSIDQRSVNLAESRVTGYSFGVRWNRRMSWGELNFSSSGEKILRNEQKILPNAVPTASVHKKFNPMRITTVLYWSRGPWDAGVTHIYGGRYWVNSTNQTLSPSRWTDDVMRFDLNASYDFGRNRGFGARGSSWWKRALHDTKLGVTIINAANTEPPLDALGFFSSSVIDMRLRRYVIDFTKRF
jgi:iron complex outermembrane receptor protein